MERSQQTTEIERILRDYYQQLYASKMGQLGRNGQILKKHKKLNQEEIENLNRPITGMEIEIVIRSLPTNKSQRASQLNSTKNSEKN